MLITTVAVANGEPENRHQIEALKTYIKENFGQPGFETSWFKQIVSVSVQGKKVVVNTKLNAKSNVAKEAGKGICSGVSGYAFSNANRALGIEHVQVLATDGG